jgi:hypothetical protein
VVPTRPVKVFQPRRQEVEGRSLRRRKV